VREGLQQVKTVAVLNGYSHGVFGECIGYLEHAKHVDFKKFVRVQTADVKVRKFDFRSCGPCARTVRGPR